MFCRKCGKEVKEGATFCGHCGAPVNPTGAPQGGLPPMTAGYGIMDSGSLGGNNNSKSQEHRIGKNQLFVAGAAVVVLVLVIGLGIALFSGKSNSIAGTWKWECGFGEFASSFQDGDFFMGNLEDIGIKTSDFPDVQGTLEFDKDGKWEFRVDGEHYIKVTLEAAEIMLDAVVEEGYLEEDQAEDAMEELKEETGDKEAVEEALSVCEWSGTYEADAKKGEIELTIKRAAGQKASAEVLLDYEIDGKKLSLEVQEDEDNQMNVWETMGIFDEDLTRK